MITDVCLCEYMSHGHCGVVREDGEVDNDVTLELLAKTAISHAEAGADVVAPSDMMDGRWRRSGTSSTRRVTPTCRSSPTAPSSPPPSTGRSARRPSRRPRSATAAATRWTRPTPRGGARGALDVEEGADVVMVKPAAPLPRRDPRRARGGRPAGRGLQRLGRVLGAEGGRRATAGSTSAPRCSRALTAIRRAGADVIITYHAKEAAGGLGVRRAVPRSARSRKGAAVPLDETDKRLLNLLQSSFPLAAAVRAGRRRGGMTEVDELMERTAAAARRAHHP